jgi:hypothetical protein
MLEIQTGACSRPTTVTHPTTMKIAQVFCDLGICANISNNNIFDISESGVDF